MADPSKDLPGQPAEVHVPPPAAYGTAPPPGYGYSMAGQTTIIGAPQPMAMTTIIHKTTPSNYLGLAIFSMLCCFLPTGIVAVVYAAQVDGAFASGDEGAARDYSEKAKCWSIATIVTGVIVDVLLVIVIPVVWFFVWAGAVADATGDWDNDWDNRI